MIPNSPRGSGFEHEGWANESPSTHHHIYKEHENLSRDEPSKLREIEIQEPSSSSTQLPSGPKPGRTQQEGDISNISIGKSSQLLEPDAPIPYRIYSTSITQLRIS
ncbi:hypothetical protein Tco_1510734 [Tanacetum coccineum]